MALEPLRMAHAVVFDTSPDWDVEIDSNAGYSLGLRAQSRDPLIADNPLQQNNEFKFPNGGDVTTNRFDFASELSVSYLKTTGFDISFDAWKDFAYNGDVATNPGLYAPGVPYSALSSAPNGHYGAFTYHYYDLGAELQNAFVFKDFTLANIPVQVKVGRFVEYWGNAIFNGSQAISYGQSPIDAIKATAAPGSEVKDLFLPRGQVSVHAQVLASLSLGFQYAFEYRPIRFPEGGTFLGITDPFFEGPESLEGAIPRYSRDASPPNVDGNFGVEALWSPDFLNGTIGFYARQFDDVSPYTPFQLLLTEQGAAYHTAYARHAHLFGLSLERTFGVVSTGFEANIRQNTGLLSTGTDLPLDPRGEDGPRGNLFNLIGNAIYTLPRSPLWDTGTLIVEGAWTRVLAVTHQKVFFNAVDYGCGPNGANAGLGAHQGCATTNEVNFNFIFDPQWLSVFPGVDIDAPVNVGFGALGNGPTVVQAGVGNSSDSVAYSVGVHALVNRKYNIKLDYAGYQSATGNIATGGLGQRFYENGSGNWQWNDKGQVQLILSTAF